MVIFKSWFIFAILALIMWGLWGFFPKLATQYITPKSAIIWEVVGSLLVGIVVAFFIKFQPEIHTKGIVFAVLTGITATLGTLFFLYAVVQGKEERFMTVLKIPEEV